jgi:hypothetical protein
MTHPVNKPVGADALPRSPLLRSKVIERNYTKQQPYAQQTEVKQEPIKEEPTVKTEEGNFEEKSTPKEPKYTPPPPVEDDVAEMEFKSNSIDDIDDEIAAGEEGAVNISAETAQAFGDIGTELYAENFPRIVHQLTCKVDLTSIEVDLPEYLETFEGINEDTMNQLKMSDENKKILKKAMREFLKAKSPKFATPEATLIMALIGVSAPTIIAGINIKKQIEKKIAELVIQKQPQNVHTGGEKK